MSDQAHFSADEFHAFRDFLRDAAGIDLGVNKQYLVATRVRKILIENCIQNLSELTTKVQSSSNLDLRQQVIDAMTTNETFWFRDTYPYEYLLNILFPQLHASERERYRIWSAACSYGQEPFSISITAEEFIRRNYSIKVFPLEILATDLSSAVLAKASQGCFDRLSVSRGLEGGRLKDHFVQNQLDSWCVKPNILERVTFKAQNLLEPYALLGKFDAIFCRNVLIYFSAELKFDILARLRKALNPGGILILGSSESLGMASDLFETVHVRPGVVYQAK